jgi:hypothetical protein
MQPRYPAGSGEQDAPPSTVFVRHLNWSPIGEIAGDDNAVGRRKKNVQMYHAIGDIDSNGRRNDSSYLARVP